MGFEYDLGMHRAKWPFARWIALHLSDDRGVCLLVRNVEDDQRAVWIEQTGVIRFHRSAGDGWADPYPLFSFGEDRIAFANRTGWGKRVQHEWGEEDDCHGDTDRPKRRFGTMGVI